MTLDDTIPIPGGDVDDAVIRPKAVLTRYFESDHIEYGNQFGTWYQTSSTPVVEAVDTWESGEVDNAHILDDDGDRYVFYEGMDSGGTELVGGAEATDDLTSTTKFAGNPLLDLGSVGSFDELHVKLPVPIEHGGTYYLYYTGQDTNSTTEIGVATASSPEGPYTKHGSNPILSPTESWETSLIYCHDVFKWGDTWFMLYRGRDTNNLNRGALGLATTTTPEDPTSWSKSSANPVIDYDGRFSLADAKATVYESQVQIAVYDSDLGSGAWRGFVAEDDELTEWREACLIDVPDDVTTPSNATAVDNYLVSICEGTNDLFRYATNRQNPLGAVDSHAQMGGVVAELTGNQDLTDPWEPVTFDNDAVDLSDEFDTATSEFTPSQTRPYLIAFNVAFEVAAAGDALGARVRDTTADSSVTDAMMAAPDGSRTILSNATVAVLTGGNTHEVQARNETNADTIVGAPSLTRAVFTPLPL